MPKRGFGQIYRQMSSKLLDLVVTPQLLGETPAAHHTATGKLTCYVLQNYSRSNALLLDAETRRLKLTPL